MKLRLWRKRQPTPGPVTLQFGGYEPPEFPTITGTLHASLPAVTLPPLSFSAMGEVDEPQIINAGQLAGSLPAVDLPDLSFSARDDTLSGVLFTVLPAVDLPDLSFSAGIQQRYDLPDADGPKLSACQRQGLARAVALAMPSAQGEWIAIPATVCQQQGEPWAQGLAVCEQQMDVLTTGAALCAQQGLPLDSAIRVCQQDTVKTDTALRGCEQHGLRVSGRVDLCHAETIKTRAVIALLEHQGIRVGGATVVCHQQGLLTAKRLQACHQQMIPLPPGLEPYDPDEPDEPPTPDPRGIILRFCWPFNGSTTLQFGCPGPPGQIIIPIKRVYLVHNQFSLVRVPDSEPILARDFSCAIDVDSWTWSWSAECPASMLDLVTPQGGQPVHLVATINGHAIRVVVEQISRARRFASAWIRVTGRGRAAMLAEPAAPVESRTNSGVATAQQLLIDALTINKVSIGWGVDWQVQDWLVPAGVWSHTGTYIDAATRIAEAGGGYVQGHDTDPTLIIKPRYPVLPWNWAGAGVDVSLPEDACETESIEWLEKPDYNQVWIEGPEGGVLGNVRRVGTIGDKPAPPITEALCTVATAARNRGEAILADAGKQAVVTVRLPVFSESGILKPGLLVEYTEQGVTHRGLTRAVSISTDFPQIWQSVRIETRE